MKMVFMAFLLSVSSLAMADSSKEWSEGISGGPGNDWDKYLVDTCKRNEDRRCFNVGEESAILDAIISTGQDIHTVVMGKNVIVMRKDEYYKWQESMSNSLAKAGLGAVHLALATPFKIAGGAVISVVGLLWSPFEKKGEIGNLTRQGLGLFTKGILDIATDAVAVVDGVTMGGPIYAGSLAYTAVSIPAKEVQGAVNAIPSSNSTSSSGSNPDLHENN